MKVFAETERLILRELLPEDAGGMFTLDSDPEVHRYLGNQPITTIEQAQAAIGFIRKQYVDEGIGRWAVIEKASGQFIGWAGLKLVRRETNRHTNFYDVGYRFIRSAWGKGYASEAAKVSVDYAFQHFDIDTLYGMADLENLASNKVLKKSGLRQTAIFDFEGIPHSWHELHRSDWERMRSS